MLRPKVGTPVYFLVPLFLLGFTMWGCGGAGSTPAPPSGGAEARGTAVSALDLVGTNWRAVEFGGLGSAKPVDPATMLTLGFGKDRYAGTGGCNWFLGVYGVAGDQMALNAPTQTVLQCQEPPGVMEQESMYLSALWNIDEYRKVDGKLLAYAVGNQLLLTFDAAEPVALEGTAWSLKFQQEDEQMAPILAQTAITATLQNGKISGSAGCSSYQGAYTLEDGVLTLSDVSVAQQTCATPPGVMEQEQLFLANLAAATGLVHTSGLLQFLNADDETVLAFGAP